MPYNSYAQINTMEDFSLIAGNSFTIYFEAYEDDGVTPMDLGGATTHLTFAPFGQPEYSELTVLGIVTGTNAFKFVLDGLTSNLSGIYILQPIIVSFFGKEYRPAQGLCTISTRTPYS